MPASIMRLKTAKGYVFVKHKDILRLVGCGSYTDIYIRNHQGHYRESKRLGIFCSKLKHEKYLCRIHKRCCVNIFEIAEDEGSNVKLKDGTWVPVSRTGRKILKQHTD